MDKNKKNIIAAIVLLLALGAGLFYFQRSKIEKNMVGTFSDEGILEEAGKISESKSAAWWLNSGGVMEMRPDGAKTNFGPLPKDSFWQKLYAKNNARDTDDGYYPQNIFRLVARGKWQNFTQQFYFNIDRINLSASSYRDGSNGVLLFNRYADGDNLYYAGVRVDGHAVIKKKIDGKYYTLAEKDILASGEKYDRDKNPNFLPLHQWIGIRSVVTNSGRDSVNIKFFADLDQSGSWKLILETTDTGSANGRSPLMTAGHAGIRTDFMDVAFKDYWIE